MPLDKEVFGAEIDKAMDVIEAEEKTAAGIKGAEVVEEIDTDVETDTDVKVETDVETDTDVEIDKKVETETAVKTDIEEEIPVQFDDSVLARALACGLSLTDAKSFPDNEALGRFVADVESNLIVETPVQDEERPAEEKSDLFKDFPKLNPDDYDSEVIKMFDRFKGVIQKQQDQLEAANERVQEVSKTTQRSGANEMRDWFDKTVADLGDDYKDALGEGAFGTLNSSSKHFANRDKIAGQMAVMNSGYQAMGVTPPSRDELFSAALRVVLTDEQTGIQERKLAGQLEKQASQHISRAKGSAQKSTSDPEDETAKILDEKFF